MTRRRPYFRWIEQFVFYPCGVEGCEGDMRYTGWSWEPEPEHRKHGKEYLHVCSKCDYQEVLTHIYPDYQRVPWPIWRRTVPKHKRPKQTRRAIEPKVNWRTNPDMPVPTRLAKLFGMPYAQQSNYSANNGGEDRVDQ